MSRNLEPWALNVIFKAPETRPGLEPGKELEARTSHRTQISKAPPPQ